MSDDPARAPRNAPAASATGAGGEMMALARRLYPICRSITGDGVRETLRILGERIPLEVHEVPSGTPVFDWTVPDEWNIRDAWMRDPAGERVVDFRASNLHVLNYSVPVRRSLALAELRPHLHTLPDRPDWIPYRTSLLPADLGLLPQPAPARVAGRGRLRGGDRLHPRAGAPDLRRVPAARGLRRTRS